MERECGRVTEVESENEISRALSTLAQLEQAMAECLHSCGGVTEFGFFPPIYTVGFSGGIRIDMYLLRHPLFTLFIHIIVHSTSRLQSRSTRATKFCMKNQN